MRFLFRYLLLALAAFLGLNALLPHWLLQDYPRSLGPQFSPHIRLDLQKPINTQQPQDILLGNSVIVNGLDPDLFQSITRRTTLHFSFNGAASAYYYLILKNIIATAESTPEYVLLFFIDNWLTRPELMVSGGPFLQIIDEVAGDDEAILLSKAYLNQLDPFLTYLDSRVMLFGERQTLKGKIDARLKYPLSDWLMDCGRDCLDNALDTAFFYDNMFPAPDPAERYRDEWSGRDWDFNNAIREISAGDVFSTVSCAREN